MFLCTEIKLFWYNNFQKDTSHCLHMNLSNFRVWCHECHNEINFEKDSNDKEISTKGKKKKKMLFIYFSLVLEYFYLLVFMYFT